MPGLLDFNFEQGLAPMGMRHEGMSAKGKGYFGLLGNTQGGYSTELSADEDGVGSFPLMVPTLNKNELASLLRGEEPTQAIYDKAISWAQTRKKRGSSPFAAPDELRYPANLLGMTP